MPRKPPNGSSTMLGARPHLKWADGLSRGYVVVDITPAAVQADWFFVPTVEERTTEERFARGFVSAAGDPHLVPAATPARARTEAVSPPVLA